jgi:hypothetical protein
MDTNGKILNFVLSVSNTTLYFTIRSSVYFYSLDRYTALRTKIIARLSKIKNKREIPRYRTLYGKLIVTRMVMHLLLAELEGPLLLHKNHIIQSYPKQNEFSWYCHSSCSNINFYNTLAVTLRSPESRFRCRKWKGKSS